ncbi:hypothetical protein J421_0629 [Gemmatirosa kalamazoonensis]|uniref:FG-GAP repeat protein n=1 Tax=Gemmatirosa kalamazoonensis TaxID=861299 RepID=W0RBI8_9BACT|nr:VCBS repeat-containing protein [Gemmatirosa kalamazoonensis]AHG88166.1 hypothetical protein J421_0629 [Gemmatirosa kalamazoonensis]
MTSRSHRHPALAAALLGALACGRSADPTADLSGRQLAERYCASCHLLPEPALLDQASWRRWVLPRMARRLGLRGVGDADAEERVEGGIAGERVRAAGVFPDSARITRAAWQRLADYYLRAAPAALGAPPTPPVAIGVPGFEVRVPTFRIASPMVTLVHVDSVRHRIFVGDATPTGPALTVLDAAGRVTASYPLPSPVSHLQLDGDTMKLVFMGKLHPSDVPRGALAVITAWRPGSSPSIAWEVDTLQRPVHASYADLNGDGVQDAVVSEFGNLTGRLAWYERTPAGVNVRHVLAPQPGAITTVVRDFDGDGHLDVLALMAQGDEGIVLFRGGARAARSPARRCSASRRRTA